MWIEKPALIDDVLASEDIENLSVCCKIDGIWYRAKPYDTTGIISRFYHAYLIIRGKAFATQYAQDR